MLHHLDDNADPSSDCAGLSKDPFWKPKIQPEPGVARMSRVGPARVLRVVMGRPVLAQGRHLPICECRIELYGKWLWS